MPAAKSGKTIAQDCDFATNGPMKVNKMSETGGEKDASGS